ncbi:MAG: hypothetical protein RTU30_11375 [Candidatus Thorarchaeota archaeon]
MSSTANHSVIWLESFELKEHNIAGLRVHADNEVAKKLYESLGFTVEASFKALIWRK